MRLISDIAVGLSCLSAALALWLVLARRISVNGQGGQAFQIALLRAALLALGACAASRLLSLVASALPKAAALASVLDAMEVFALAVAFSSSLGVCALLAVVARRPQRDASSRLREKAERHATDRQGAIVVEVNLEGHGPTRWIGETIEPVRRAFDGAEESATGAARPRQDEELLRLSRELTHRTKNLLAVVMGLCRQSAESSPNVAAFITRFDGRIRALSVTHELLVDSAWRGAELQKLIGRIWSSASAPAAERVSIVGPQLILRPESAQNIALAIHEMAASALEYGFLLESGRWVRIELAPYVDDATHGFDLIWKEDCPDSRFRDDDSGFGKSFVRDLLPRAVNGWSDLQSTEEGLRWTLRLPEQNFVHDSSA
jgi:two-component sensor histidine kinase